MSRYDLFVPYTTEIKQALKTRLKIEHEDFPVRAAWGFDAPTCGYFFQLWVEPSMNDDDNYEDDVYLEDGLVGESNFQILNKLKKYGFLSIAKEQSPDHFKSLCLDNPF